MRLHLAAGGDTVDDGRHPLPHAKHAVMPIIEVINHAYKMFIVSKFKKDLT